MFSIIIPTFNNVKYLEKCVESIRKNSTYNHEIIPHVNEGSDGTIEYLKKNNIEYTFTNYNSGICKGMNMAAKKEELNTTSLRESEIESFISGLGLAKKYNKKYKKNLKAKEIFDLYRKHDIEADKFIDEFKINLAMSLSTIINILDPDAFVFGGGVSNSIDFFNEIQTLVKKYVIGREYDGVFLKPKFGDASGVRGAARLGRKTTY